MVHWLKLRTSTAGATDSIPGGGSSTCLWVWPKKKNTEKNGGEESSFWIPFISDGSSASFLKVLLC